MCQRDAVEFDPGMRVQRTVDILERTKAQLCRQPASAQPTLHEERLAQTGDRVDAACSGDCSELREPLRICHRAVAMRWHSHIGTAAQVQQPALSTLQSSRSHCNVHERQQQRQRQEVASVGRGKAPPARPLMRKVTQRSATQRRRFAAIVTRLHSGSRAATSCSSSRRRYGSAKPGFDIRSVLGWVPTSWPKYRSAARSSTMAWLPLIWIRAFG